LPGTPYANFLPDQSFCRLRKEAQGITTEISARVFTCGERALEWAFDFLTEAKVECQEEHRPFTRDAPTSALVGITNLWRKEESRSEFISDQLRVIKPLSPLIYSASPGRWM